MKQHTWRERLMNSTRGRILKLLRRASQTVNELAAALHLTDNAVRAHLDKLERDGLVQQIGIRPGVRKPHFEYALTPDAEQLFPKAYGPILRQLLDVLNEQLSPAEVHAVLHEVARRIAAAYSETRRDPDLRRRVTTALKLLEDLGGSADLEEEDDNYIIRGHGCPLSAIVPGHPEVCHMVESLLSDVLGMPVTEHCQRGDMPRCCFTIAPPANHA